MIWPVSINWSSLFRRSGIGASRMLCNGRLYQSLSFSQDSCRMGCKSPSPSWPPHRFFRCCCELASRIRVLLAEVQVEVLWEFPSRLLLSAFPRLDVVPELVRVFQCPFPRQNSTSCLELQSFHVDSIALQVVFSRTDLHLSKPCFVPTKCSSDDASRPPQQLLIHLFLSLAARTS